MPTEKMRKELYHHSSSPSDYTRSEHVESAPQEQQEARAAIILYTHGKVTQLRVNRWRAPFTFYTTTLKNL